MEFEMAGGIWWGDMWAVVPATDAKNCVTASVAQGERRGGGSSGWLRGEVTERRRWEEPIKTRLKDIGKHTRIHDLYS